MHKRQILPGSMSAPTHSLDHQRHPRTTRPDLRTVGSRGPWTGVRSAVTLLRAEDATLSLGQIARMVGVSRQRVHQIVQSAATLERGA